jgi:hypothetical protein
MTENPQPAQHGPLYWIGITLLALWNTGLFLLAVSSRNAYENCVANDGFICMDFSGPVLVVMLAVDGVVAFVAALVHCLRVRRARLPE